MNHHVPVTETLGLWPSLAIVAAIFLAYGLVRRIYRRLRGRPTNDRLPHWRREWRKNTKRRR